MPKKNRDNNQEKNKTIKSLSIEEAIKALDMKAPVSRGGLTDAAAVDGQSIPQGYAGILIANKNRPAEKGTLGGIVASDKGDIYGLTCFHVIKQNNQDFTQFLPEESVEVITENGHGIGSFDQSIAIINSKLDIALIKLKGKFHNNTIGSPTKILDVKEADKGTEVYFFNDRNKEKVKGFIRKINQKGNWRLGKYENVIFVSSDMRDDMCERISDEGDSGSWMMRTSDNALVGVVFANSATSTWVMPFTEIIDAYKKKNITLTLNIFPE